tara:strand:+ start:133 stop:327 length:195 start_codon:yes stop_codon:yes gene_type:complete
MKQVDKMTKLISTDIDLLPEDMQLIYYDWLDEVPVDDHKIKLIELYIKIGKEYKRRMKNDKLYS